MFSPLTCGAEAATARSIMTIALWTACTLPASLVFAEDGPSPGAAADPAARTELEREIEAFREDPFFEDIREEDARSGLTKHHRPTVFHVIQPVTQGPLWPPAETVDENGDFLVVGVRLNEVAPGFSEIVPTRGALVSKNTVPPLDENGREDFSNPLGAPYDVIRELDLSPGSPDRDIEMYTISYGPARGDFGGEARIPAEGDSPYNLNQLGLVCEEAFPSTSQDDAFRRESFPLVSFPVPSFRGDQVQYDADTGAPFDPQLGSGSNCFPDGCSGEDITSFRPTEPITLGRWMKARALLKIRLENYDPEQGAFTHARFSFYARGLIPNAVYTFWSVRLDNLLLSELPDPLALPNVRMSDRFGRIRASYLVENPFPDPQGPDALSRIIVTSLVYHPDYQNWGACFGRLGPGVDVVAHLSTASEGEIELAEGFVTVAPRR